MDKEIIKKLDQDEHYYGEFGKQFLSNSDISALLAEDPLKFKNFGSSKKPAFVIGSYFHVNILEPHKLDKFKVSTHANRRTKAYKEEAGEDILILQKEVKMCQDMAESVYANDEAADLIMKSKYEVPGYAEINGVQWKGKADAINDKLKRVVDLKSTRSLEAFNDSITNYNYDSQAYVYEALFGYRLVFIAVEKTAPYRLRVMEATDDMLKSGKDKVERASAIYKEWFNK